MDWGRCSEVFQWDGSLRDIYVLGTDGRDWQQLLDFLRAEWPKAVFEVNGAETPIPRHAAEIFARKKTGRCLLGIDHAAEIFSNREMGRCLLRIDLGGLQLICHFFTVEEIEFDLDPREMRGEAEFSRLLGFMQSISRLLGKPVLLTPENEQERPLLAVDPDRSLIYFPPLSTSQD